MNNFIKREQQLQAFLKTPVFVSISLDEVIGSQTPEYYLTVTCSEKADHPEHDHTPVYGLYSQDDFHKTVNDIIRKADSEIQAVRSELCICFDMMESYFLRGCLENGECLRFEYYITPHDTSKSRDADEWISDDDAEMCNDVFRKHWSRDAVIKQCVADFMSRRQEQHYLTLSMFDAADAADGTNDKSTSVTSSSVMITVSSESNGSSAVSGVFDREQFVEHITHRLEGFRLGLPAGISVAGGLANVDPVQFDARIVIDSCHYEDADQREQLLNEYSDRLVRLFKGYVNDLKADVLSNVFVEDHAPSQEQWAAILERKVKFPNEVHSLEVWHQAVDEIKAKWYYRPSDLDVTFVYEALITREPDADSGLCDYSLRLLCARYVGEFSNGHLRCADDKREFHYNGYELELELGEDFDDLFTGAEIYTRL